MKKRILLGLVGIIAILPAIYLFSLFLASTNEGGNVFFLLGSLVCAAVMVYCFIQANKFEEPDPDTPIRPIKGDSEGSNLLEERNKMIREYGKTQEAKERLHMLELADSAEKT